jgi:hypothetical protein
MAHYRCEKCGKIEEATEPPAACPACGAEAGAAYPGGPASSFLLAQESFDRMFDAEAPAAAPPREKRDPTGPAFIAAITVEDPQPDATAGGLLSRATDERQDGAGAGGTASAPISAEPTLELKDADLEVGPPPAPQPEAGRPALAKAETGPDLPPAHDPGGPLSASPTLELKDEDLEVAGQTPPAPRDRVVIDGLGSPKELHGRIHVGGLAARNTLELDDQDLEELSPRAGGEGAAAPPAAPPPDPAPSAGSAAPVVRPARGRVAFPIASEEGSRAPAARPREVDELAVAGEPPVPPRRARPLTSQTETLRSFKARKRRRAALGAAFLVGAVAIGGAVYLVMNRGGTERAAAPDAGRPDLRPPDARRPDLARDLASPDQPEPDAVVSRPIARGPRPTAKPEAERGGGAAVRPTVAGLYQEGLQRLMRGENAEAVRLFNEVLAKSPTHGLAVRGLGLAYEKMGRRAMAREAFNRYLGVKPNAPDAELIRKRIERLK